MTEEEKESGLLAEANDCGLEYIGGDRKFSLPLTMVLWNHSTFDDENKVIPDDIDENSDDECPGPVVSVGFAVQRRSWVILYQTMTELEDGKTYGDKELAIPLASVLSITRLREAKVKVTAEA